MRVLKVVVEGPGYKPTAYIPLHPTEEACELHLHAETAAVLAATLLKLLSMKEAAACQTP